MATATKTSFKNWGRAVSNLIALILSPSVRQILAIFSAVEFWDCIKVQKKKKKAVAVFTSFTKREIRHFHVVVVQWRQRNVQKKRDARAKLLFCHFVSFYVVLLTSPSSLLKFPNKDLTNVRVNHESIDHMTSWPHLSASCEKTSNKNPTHRACILYIYRTSMVHLDRMPTV